MPRQRPRPHNAAPISIPAAKLIPVVCPSGDDVIWAARHPVRNALAVFVLGLFAGSLSIYLNRRLQ